MKFNANAPCDAGTYEWTTDAYNGTDFSTAYDLVGSQPSVTVTGSCAAAFNGWQSHDYCTYTQGGWGAVAKGANPGTIRDGSFSTVYPEGIGIGIPQDEGHSMTFTNTAAAEAYLPAGGTAGALTEDLTDPTSSSAGVFGGQVLALRINLHQCGHSGQ